MIVLRRQCLRQPAAHVMVEDGAREQAGETVVTRVRNTDLLVGAIFREGCPQLAAGTRCVPHGSRLLFRRNTSAARGVPTAPAETAG